MFAASASTTLHFAAFSSEIREPVGPSEEFAATLRAFL
jgi:hypothetical protein